MPLRNLPSDNTHRTTPHCTRIALYFIASRWTRHPYPNHHADSSSIFHPIRAADIAAATLFTTSTASDSGRTRARSSAHRSKHASRGSSTRSSGAPLRGCRVPTHLQAPNTFRHSSPPFFVSPFFVFPFFVLPYPHARTVPTTIAGGRASPRNSNLCHPTVCPAQTHLADHST
jgi:hypothetical protein